MDYDKKSLKAVLDLNKAAKLVLPNFQRNFVWKAEAQEKALLASFFLELPIGSILTLKGTNEDFAARDLCTQEEVEPSNECLYLLDGQQRVSTLKSVFCNLFSTENWRKDWDDMFKDLRNRWYIRIDNDGGNDFFGLSKLQFTRTLFSTIEPEQFIDNIIYKKIQVGNTSESFHPGYNPKDESGAYLDDLSKRKNIANDASKQLLVPLYEMYGYTNTNPIHKLVLDRIATKRAQDLELEHENRINDAIQLLSSVEPDIKELYEAKDSAKISLAWSRLGITWATDVKSFLEGIINYELSQISLPADEMARAFAIFEVINQTNTPLDIYDLTAAKAARIRELPSLSIRIKAIIDEPLNNIDSLTSRILGDKPSTIVFDNFSLMSEDATPAKVVKNQYLNLLSLLTHVEYGNIEVIDKVDYIKRTKILSIKTEQINTCTPKAINALKRAFAFLHIRCGIDKVNSLSYELMLLPIAYALANDDFWQSSSHIDKIEYWYWSSLFGGSYREKQNSRCVEDIRQLYDWLKGGDNPFITRALNIFNAPGYSDPNVLLMDDVDNNVPTAIHQGMLQYTLSRQPQDFIKSEPEIRLNTWDVIGQKEVVIRGNNYLLSIQDHHIYPLSAATSLFESSRIIRADKKNKLNSPLNRTYISAAANNIIRAATPDQYFPQVSQQAKDKHSLPLNLENVYLKLDGETDTTYHTRLLNSRYEVLVRDIRLELEILAGA